MTQYCRYCTNMVCGDANYCSVRKICFTDAKIKRTNKCKDFEFNPIDALGENADGYRPRQKKLDAAHSAGCDYWEILG